MAKVLLKKSSVSSNAPGTGDLDYGEVAINYADGRLYYKNSSNAIKNFVDSDLIDNKIGTTIQAYDGNLTSFVNTFTLPTSDGSINQVLKTDGAGTLSFVDQSAGGSALDSDELLDLLTDPSLQLVDSSGSVIKTYWHAGGVVLNLYDSSATIIKSVYGNPYDKLEILDSSGSIIEKLWGGFPGASGNLSSVGQSIIPALDSAYDLGSPTKKWKELYLSGQTIHIGGAKIQTDAETGSVAIIPKTTQSTPNPKALLFGADGRFRTLASNAGKVSKGDIQTAISSDAGAAPLDSADVISLINDNGVTTGKAIAMAIVFG